MSITANPIDAMASVNNLTGEATVGPAGTFNLNAKQLINGIVDITSGSTSTINLPSAAAVLLGARGVKAFDFEVINRGTGTATVVLGSGMTSVGTLTVATVSYRRFKGIINAGTVTLYALTSAAY